MRKTGLVLAGGGGKGAYQIGVWKALKEYGIENSIQVVSGTSIGALNASLFVQGDYDIAENVWLNISKDKVLSVDPEKLIAAFAQYGLKIAGVPPLQRWLMGVKNHGVFSRQGLLEIIDENLNLDYVSNSDIVSYATCCELPNLKANYFNLNCEENEKITDILLASSALPVVYESVEIDGKRYFDGGLPVKNADNVPVQPVYDEGCDLIFVVHLSREYVLDAKRFPNAQIIEIVPQDDQGGLFSGTLDFTKQGASRRIEQGYRDAIRILKPIFEMAMTQAKVSKSLQQIKNDENQFRVKRESILDERTELKSEIDILLNSSRGN